MIPKNHSTPLATVAHSWKLVSSVRPSKQARACQNHTPDDGSSQRHRSAASAATIAVSIRHDALTSRLRWYCWAWAC